MKFLDAVEINPKISLAKGKIYPFVEMANVGFYERNPKDIDYKPFSSGVKFEKGDTVIARITPCLQNGKGFYCKEISQGFGSTEYLVFRPKAENIDNRYLYYFMQTRFIRESMIKSMVGATGRQRVNNEVFERIEVDFPELPIQRKIANALSAYDDIIENNQKQIKILEEAAQRLYKEWFVDLRFPGYENVEIVNGVPEGWIACILDDVIEFDPKVTLKKDSEKQFIPMSALSTTSMILDENEYKVVTSNSGSKFQNGDTLLARITPCLENGKTAFVQGLISDSGAIGSTEYIVMRSKKWNPYMVYLLARTHSFREYAIRSMSGSDGRQRVKRDKLQRLQSMLPSENIICEFEDIVKPIFDQIYLLNAKNKRLAEARDRLLPKLMSGEIEV